MAKYRKKPVVIDAIQWDCTQESFEKILDLKSNRTIEWPEDSRHLFIHT